MHVIIELVSLLISQPKIFLQLLKKWETRERKKMRDYEKEKDREDERKTEEVGRKMMLWLYVNTCTVKFLFGLKDFSDTEMLTM